MSRPFAYQGRKLCARRFEHPRDNFMFNYNKHLQIA